MAKEKKLSDSEKIDHIIAVLKANGLTLPAELGGEPEAEDE